MPQQEILLILSDKFKHELINVDIMEGIRNGGIKSDLLDRGRRLQSRCRNLTIKRGSWFLYSRRIQTLCERLGRNL